jgi:hypothetical protein
MSIVALAVGFYTIQWNRAQYFGKTPEQIVAMGHAKWSELHGKKKGYSTVDMCESEDKFGHALKNINDRALKSQSQTRRTWMLQMRKAAMDYGYAAHELGYYSSGGGSMWRLFDASIYPDVEEVIAANIKGERMPMIKMMSFDAMYKKLDDAMNKWETLDPKSAMYSKEDHEKVKKAYSNLKSKQKPIEALMSKGKHDDALRFRLFLMRKLETARGIEE